MNLSPLQLDTNCFSSMSHYHPTYYPPNTSNWSSSPTSSSSSLLCPSTAIHYPPLSIPSVLQPIENYCFPDSYYPSRDDPMATSSELSFCPSATPIGSISHPYSPDEYIHPASSSSAMILPQNRANYTRHQLVMLNEIYKKYTYPNSLQKTLIAKYIGVSRDQIRIWFQNKRRKVQLIKKGQAKQTKSDVECEYGEYRRHLPNNFLDDLYQELHSARAAPARLPVKRDHNSKTIHPEQDQQQQVPFYPTMNSMYYYQPTHRIDHDESSHDQHSVTDYPPHLYSNRL